MNFGENFLLFLGKCLVMLSMTSMTASYATAFERMRETEVWSCSLFSCSTINGLLYLFIFSCGYKSVELKSYA